MTPEQEQAVRDLDTALYLGNHYGNVNVLARKVLGALSQTQSALEQAQRELAQAKAQLANYGSHIGQYEILQAQQERDEALKEAADATAEIKVLRTQADLFDDAVKQCDELQAKCVEKESERFKLSACCAAMRFQLFEVSKACADIIGWDEIDADVITKLLNEHNDCGQTLLDQRERHVKALEFYANPATWIDHNFPHGDYLSHAYVDQGKEAREALKETCSEPQPSS